MAGAIEALMLVVELGGPPMFARIGVMRALNRNVVRELRSDAWEGTMNVPLRLRRCY
jgi:hypothetical protein